MKIRLDEKEGLDAGKAIEIEKEDKSHSDHVCVTIWNDEEHTSIKLDEQRAREIAKALIAASSKSGVAGN